MLYVSIPLESGHIVIISGKRTLSETISFNPLRIGSYCNVDSAYINELAELGLVSIPLESGHIVILIIKIKEIL